MNKLNVMVFFGGCSSEYSVSLASAFAVLSNLNPAICNPIPIGITKQGKWYYFQGEFTKIKQDIWANSDDCIPAMLSLEPKEHTLFLFEKSGVRSISVDVAFPVLHGKNGEDGTIQGAIALAGIPLAGCGVLSSALCMDKDRAHKMVSNAGVCTAKAFVADKTTSKQKLLELAETVGYPLFVKPVKAGSSYGITKVFEDKALHKAIDLAFQYDEHILIEENITGFEVGCAILGTDALCIGEVDEIELSADGFFDFTEKYTLNTSQIHVPARISQAKADEVKETAQRIYRALGCSGFARVDLFLTPSGEIVFNEVNTIPGFTEHSRFPGMMRAAGYSFQEILDRIIKQAVDA